MRERTWVIVVTGVVLVVACAAAIWVAQRPEPVGAAVPASSDAIPAAFDAAELLHDWDVRRAAAYSRGDVAALRALYAAGSTAGRRDVRLLRSYRARGLRVVDLTTQLLRVRAVEGTDPDAPMLLVTDRLAGGVAVGAGTRVALPASRPRTRLVRLVQRAGDWVVAEVRPMRAG